VLQLDCNQKGERGGNMDTKKMTELVKNLINKDELEMTETELDLVWCPQQLADTQAEILRLRALVDDLAHDRVSNHLKPLLYQD
jgi:hypothetical protein